MFLLVLVFVSLQLTACGGQKGHSTVEGEKSNSSKTGKQPYSVLSESYVIQAMKKDIKINYPQVRGLSNESTQDSVNRTLKEEALKIAEVYHSDDGGVSLDVDFVIKRKSERYVSVQYIGFVYLKNTPHPTNAYRTRSGTTWKLK